MLLSLRGSLAVRHDSTDLLTLNQASKLDIWIDDTVSSGLAPIVRFAWACAVTSALSAARLVSTSVKGAPHATKRSMIKGSAKFAIADRSALVRRSALSFEKAFSMD